MTKAEDVIESLTTLSFRCFCGLEHHNLEESDMAATMLCACLRRWAPRGTRPVTSASPDRWYFVGRR